MGSSSHRSAWRAFLRIMPLAMAIVAVVAWAGLDGRAVGASTFTISGRVTDVLTGKPMAGVQVRVLPEGPVAVSNANGWYSLAVGQGSYDVQASVAGYITTTVGGCRADNGKSGPVDFEMVPANPSEQEEELLYSRLVKSPSSTYDAEPTGELVSTPLSALPSTIRVLRTGSNTVEVMDLEQYLRGVVPSEMPAYWHSQALRAQAVAARCYAVQAVADPRHGTADVCDGTHCQAWTNTYRDTTDAAVSDTRGVVATYDGGVISAYFFSRCNAVSTRNSEDALIWQTCKASGWSKVLYCRARPCGGHDPYPSSCGYYGHGVGMCQWGAEAKAESGKDYRTILTDFYTGVTISGPAAPTLTSPINGQLAAVGTQQTFRWNATGDQHYISVWQASGGWSVSSGWITATSWSTTMPTTAGTYYWRVKARKSGVEGDWSETRKLILATAINGVHLPFVAKN